MSQLIQLKQRIKAIEVIKKITHAMRLISMSSRLKMIKHSENLQLFSDEITPLLCSLEKVHSIINENQSLNKKVLILIASEKGLCGNFNTIIFNHFEHYIASQNINEYIFISVGKQAGEYLTHKGFQVTARFDKLSGSQLEKTATHLYEYLISNKALFSQAICFYNKSRTFFVQEPDKFQLLPTPTTNNSQRQELINLEDYHWLQEQADVMRCIFQSLLKLNILSILSKSIIAEQSARFLSMDSSTRNAETLLKKMTLEYNKIRQTKITKELTELISSF